MNITFIEAVKRFYSNYANFNGRATAPSTGIPYSI